MSLPTDSSRQLDYTSVTILPTYSSATYPTILYKMEQVEYVITQLIQ